MAVLKLQIDNMHCGACVRRVLETLKTLPDTRVEEVRVGTARVDTETGPTVLTEALGAAGFPARIEK